MPPTRGHVSAWLADLRTRIATASGACGMDGFATLALSNLAIVATGGLFWLFLLRRVYVTARQVSARHEAGAYLLVLGMRLRHGAVAPEYARRLDRARDLLTGNPTCKAVLLGGATSSAPCSEALAGQHYLTQKGIPANRLTLEDRSRHTLENLREARMLLGTGGLPAPLLITNRFHLARSSAIADGLGIPHQLCAAESELLLDASTLLRLARESYLLHWYYVGKTWARWTQNEKMLGRIS